MECIISQFPGGGGRFLSNFVYRLLNSMDDPVKLVPGTNSAHVEYLHDESWEFSIDIGPTTYYRNRPDALLVIRPLREHAVFNSLVWPNWAHVESNPHLKNTKFILLRVQESSYPEVSFYLNSKATIVSIIEYFGSSEYKNVMELHNDTILRYMKLFELEYKYPITLENCTKEDTLFKLIKLTTKYMKISGEYFKTRNFNVPDHYRDRTFILDWEEIFIEENGSYVALNKLTDFLGKIPKPNLLNSWKYYVNKNKAAYAMFDTKYQTFLNTE